MTNPLSRSLPTLASICFLLAASVPGWSMELDNQPGDQPGTGSEHTRAPASDTSDGVDAAAGPVVPLQSGPSAERTTLRQMADTCFDSLLNRYRQTSDSAYCDVLVDELNRDLSRTSAEERLLVAAYHNRAVRNLRLREFELAASDLEAALSLQPELAELYLTRGNLYLAWNRFSEAIDDYTTAFERSAGALVAARRNRALAWRGVGNLEAAQIDWNAVRTQTFNANADDPAATISPGGTTAQPLDEYR